MKILLCTFALLLTASACDRSKGKGSDIEWQQRQEMQRQEMQRQEQQEKRYEQDKEEQHYKDLIYRNLDSERKEGLQNAGPT